MSHLPLVIERTFNAPVEKVWEAITDKDQMKQWYFELAGFKPEVGFEFSFNGESEGVTYIHLCRVVEVIPNKKLAHTWTYKDHEGLSLLTWDLIDGGENTRVRLTHEGLETFPNDTKDFSRESFTAGWNHILGTSLKEYLDKQS